MSVDLLGLTFGQVQIEIKKGEMASSNLSLPRECGAKGKHSLHSIECLGAAVDTAAVFAGGNSNTGAGPR